MRRFRITKLLAVVALVFIFGGAMTLSAQAFLIDFNILAGSGGTGDYDGLGGPFVGADINVTSVFFDGTPNYSGQTLALTNGKLNFVTGDFVSHVGFDYFFAGGGAITITGGIAGLGIPALDGNGDPTVLLTGFFTLAPPAGGDYPDVKYQGASNTFLAAFNDLKNECLLTELGLAGFIDLYLLGSINLGFTGTLSEAGFSLASASGDVTNVPVPPAALLLGSGLLGLVGLGWRRKKS